MARKCSKAAARKAADTPADSVAVDCFRALCVPTNVIPGLVAKVTGAGVLMEEADRIADEWRRDKLMVECDRLADEWQRDKGLKTQLEFRPTPHRSHCYATVDGLRRRVDLYRQWWLDSPADFVAFRPVVERLWNNARRLGVPPPMPSVEGAQEAVEAADVLLAWCDRATAATQPAAPGEPQAAAEKSLATAPGVALRNAWFLAQYEARDTATYRKPKRIQEKWWAMTDKERAAICPDSPGKATHATVVQGFKLARKQRDGKTTKAKSKRKRVASKK